MPCTATLSLLTTRMVLSAQELFAIEKKKGSRWHGQQEDGDHAVLAAVDEEVVAAEAWRAAPCRSKTQRKKHVI